MSEPTARATENALQNVREFTVAVNPYAEYDAAYTKVRECFGEIISCDLTHAIVKVAVEAARPFIEARHRLNESGG